MSQSSVSPTSTSWNTNRLVTLLKTQWLENKRGYVHGVTIMALLHLLWMLVSLLIGIPIDHEVFILGYWMGLYLFGALFASRYFRSLSEKGSALIWLMRPTSSIEKYALTCLSILVAFSAVYTAVYLLLSLPMSWFSQVLADFQYNQALQEGNEVSKPTYADHALYVPFLSHLIVGGSSKIGADLLASFGYTCITGFMASMAVYLHKNVLLRTLLIGFVLCLITIVIIAVTKSAFGDYLFIWFQSEPPTFTPWWAHLSSAMFWLGTPISMWVSVYVNIKDRELT